MKHTIFFTLIAVNIFSFKTLNAQTKCDTLSEDVYVSVEIMPLLNTPIEKLENKLNDSIQLNDFAINEGLIFFATLIVNCKGEDLDYRIINYKNDTFCSKLIECLKLNTQWTPGFYRGKPVDVACTLKFQVVNSKIKISYDRQPNGNENLNRLKRKGRLTKD